jgi:hypothetical protein
MPGEKRTACETLAKSKRYDFASDDFHPLPAWQRREQLCKRPRNFFALSEKHFSFVVTNAGSQLQQWQAFQKRLETHPLAMIELALRGSSSTRLEGM